MKVQMLDFSNVKIRARMLLIAAALLCLALMNSGTVAYFTTSDTARNVITFGKIDVELHEKDAEGNDFVDPVNVLPGDKVDKIVTVENTGDSECWVRVRVGKSFELADENKGKDVDISLIALDINQSEWAEKDGWYYYNEALEVGESTEALFTAVTFGKDMGNLYQNSKAVVDVAAQGVQCANNGTSALSAAGWPEEGGSK